MGRRICEDPRRLHLGTGILFHQVHGRRGLVPIEGVLGQTPDCGGKFSCCRRTGWEAHQLGCGVVDVGEVEGVGY